MHKNYYEYEDRLLSLAELEALHGVSREVIRSRIKAGWSVEAAAETPLKAPDSIAPEWIGKTLKIQFLQPIPQVFRSMQPNLASTYIAHPHLSANQRQKTRPFYTITLENGLPLIVYPEDFQIIGEAAQH